MCQLIDEHAETIRNRYPKVVRRSGGYALDALIDLDKLNLAKLMCGSEGTLGIVLEAKLKLSQLPKHSALCLAHFTSLDAALRSAPLSVKAGASAAELIDGVIIRQARYHPLSPLFAVLDKCDTRNTTISNITKSSLWLSQFVLILKSSNGSNIWRPRQGEQSPTTCANSSKAGLMIWKISILRTPPWSEFVKARRPFSRLQT
jgi:hypothetical protein